MSDDKRLIEDYLPIVEISAEASGEKNTRKGHISTLHLWWARRPLVACRAAVYAALVPASQFVPNGASDEKKKSLGRANAAKFLKRLCRYPSNSKPDITADIHRAVSEAQQHILHAHADRLTQETGKPVTVEDILTGHAPRPRVLDMFAGGGAIPLEALRLGCQACASDLNPVAHIIELCTLVYPQKFGKPDPNALGATGPKNANGESTWGGLAKEVGYWGKWVLEKVRAEIGDLYPALPDPKAAPAKDGDAAKVFEEPQSVMGFAEDAQRRLKPKPIAAGHLTPVAYLWTRTVRCKNPTCAAIVPLVRQTWLCKKDDRCVAAKMIAHPGTKRVRFEVVEATSPSGLGFDPEAFSKGGNATCPFCGTVADSDYVKDEGCAGRIGNQMIAAGFVQTTGGRKIYFSPDTTQALAPDESSIQRRIAALLDQTGLKPLEEPISNDAKNANFCVLYGITRFADLFTSRQTLALFSFAAGVIAAEKEMRDLGFPPHHTIATATCLAMLVDRLAVYSSTQCVWHYIKGERTAKTFGRQALPMTWDYAESVPFNEESASWPVALEWLVPGLEGVYVGLSADVRRGSALALGWEDGTIDAIVSDPPYYDNVPYANISDYFYVWLRRCIGHHYPEHFATQATPKKSEAVADAVRHGGDKKKANDAYEEMMSRSFLEAHRVLKPSGQMTIVYAHKTTLGWATLVDAMRKAGFTVTEAWPLDTEMKSRLRGRESAALASSIFLVARKREGAMTGYEEQVRPELEEIVRERVETLWDMGISGADLVIASVGAGLRAFTRFARVEYTNGEEVPAERFLTEVETVVLETILARLSKEVGGKGGRYSLANLDTTSRFYVLWRYTYAAAELDAGEAIIFANGTHVELDGQHGLAGGNDALVEKKKSKYHLRDYVERGENDKLGLGMENGQAAPLIDMLHRTLWLMEKRPTELGAFLSEAQPNREQLRLVAQALAGPALKGGEIGDISPTAELSALGKLTANWQSVVEDAAQTTGQKEERKIGQKQMKY